MKKILYIVNVAKEKYMELLSIGVDPIEKNREIGSAMIKNLVDNFLNSVFEYIIIETDRNNNGANHFNQKNVFYFVTHM